MGGNRQKLKPLILEFEKILKEQAEKSNKEIAGLRSEIEKVKVDGALVTAASKNQAINPEQVKKN